MKQTAGKRLLWAAGLCWLTAFSSPAQADAPLTNNPAPADPLAELRAQAEAGDATAQFALGEKLRSGDGVTTNETEAAAWLQKSAALGNAAAQFQLATLFDRGAGVPQDAAEALKWYGKAANQGFATAGYVLGARHASGQGARQDDAEAVKWYRKAAEAGDASAQFDLAGMLSAGRGAARDEDEAIKWFQKAATNGHAAAQFTLAEIYAEGRGVTKDFAEAAKWYRAAAKQGDASAAYRLATLFADGLVMPLEGESAVTWYRKAAEQGHVSAQYSLGYRYARGDGVGRKPTEAVTWFRKAAEQGDASAQFELGELYARGRGVKQDRLEALKWILLAQAQGVERATNSRADLEKRLSVGEIAEAERRAQELLNRFKPGATIEHSKKISDDGAAQREGDVQVLEEELSVNPTNFLAVLHFTSACLQAQQTNRATATLDRLAGLPEADANVLFAVARSYHWAGEPVKMEAILERLTRVQPEQPEIWYELAGARASLGKSRESLLALRSALGLSARRLAQNPQAPDLLAELRKDGRFNPLRDLPEFQNLAAH